MADLLLRLVVAARTGGAPHERGATAVEYALLAACVAGVIFATVALLAPRLVPFFQEVLDALP